MSTAVQSAEPAKAAGPGRPALRGAGPSSHRQRPGGTSRAKAAATSRTRAPPGATKAGAESARDGRPQGGDASQGCAPVDSEVPSKEPADRALEADNRADALKRASLDKNYPSDYRPHTTNYEAAKYPSHRSYMSFNPTCNKLLAKKWDEHNRQLHLRKLRRTKATIDNRPPKAQRHLEVNVRKIQNEEARLAEIERQSSILYEKMADITKATAKEYDYSKRLQPDPEYLHMLHTARRQRQLDMIHKQNRAMLMRLETKGANYSHEQWEKDRNRNLYYLRNIASFPRKFVEESERLWKGQKLASATAGHNVEKLPPINQKPGDAGPSVVRTTPRVDDLGQPKQRQRKPLAGNRFAQKAMKPGQEQTDRQPAARNGDEAIEEIDTSPSHGEAGEKEADRKEPAEKPPGRSEVCGIGPVGVTNTSLQQIGFATARTDAGHEGQEAVPQDAGTPARKEFPEDET